jgi:pyruvate,water dikinase
MGQKLADLHGVPQDIEWAFDAADDLYLLQSRPITTV